MRRGKPWHFRAAILLTAPVELLKTSVVLIYKLPKLGRQLKSVHYVLQPVKTSAAAYAMDTG